MNLRSTIDGSQLIPPFALGVVPTSYEKIVEIGESHRPSIFGPFYVILRLSLQNLCRAKLALGRALTIRIYYYKDGHVSLKFISLPKEISITWTRQYWHHITLITIRRIAYRYMSLDNCILIAFVLSVLQIISACPILRLGSVANVAMVLTAFCSMNIVSPASE